MECNSNSIGAGLQRVEQVLHQLLHDQEHAVALQGPMSRLTLSPKPLNPKIRVNLGVPYNPLH